MCGTCGCGTSAKISGGHHQPHHHQAGPHDHHPGGDHQHHLKPGSRRLDLEVDLLAANDAIAARNRRRFERAGTLALNLVSSPGSGKTTLLVQTLEALGPGTPVAVIEGDQATSHDAERIRAAGVPAIQINTGAGCHLDAAMIEQALARLDGVDGSLLFIENVGNLVCPAAFDLGEAAKVVIVSVTEGEDKPLKYPGMFRAAKVMLVSKCDLLPFLRVDVERLIGHARRVNPSIEVLQVSAEADGGLAPWLAWLEQRRRAVRSAA